MTKMKVKDFIAKDYDIDVYDNVCEELGIAKCGAYSLTDEGKQEWADVLEYDIEVYEENCCAVVDVDGNEGVWQKKLRRAKNFFYSLAGYCSEENYDKWFIEIEG